jgi:hypothetical protein
MAEVLGIIADAIGLVTAASTFFASPQSSSTTVRIAVGLNTANGLQDAGGDVPLVSTHNANYDQLGSFDPWICGGGLSQPGQCGLPKIQDGSTYDMTISQDTSQQALYVQVETQGSDGICLAYISATWPDGQQWMWLGDFAAYCDVPTW